MNPQQIPGVGPETPPPGAGEPAGRTAAVISGGPTGGGRIGAGPSGTTLRGSVGRIILLGTVASLAVWGAFPLAHAHAWPGLAVLVAVTLLIFYIYLSPRRIPFKYLLPGTLFLIAFQVIPVLYTATTAFSNFGDGHRGSKQDAITAIQGASLTRVPGSSGYTLAVATTGDPDTGPLVFLLTDQSGGTFVGTSTGIRQLAGASVESGRITAADGYTLLNLGERNARANEIAAITVPTSDGAIRSSGLSAAYDLSMNRRYDEACDCITDRTTGKVWKSDRATGSFVADDGEHLAQGWRISVGFHNFTRALTDPRISGPFLRTLLWNFAFAIASVLVTFVLGLLCALALHSERVRGRKLYRILLVLPYAMPSFAMLLVWRDMFNQDFGLVNHLLNADVNWFGGVWTARVAVILVQLWLGYPYMFLVATGALQAIPAQLSEAATVDGASAWQRFRAVTLPLLLVALSPLLISSFAYNFNNFNAIYLTTEGGPFSATNSTIGATDLLITYTYRLGFGAQGAQYGLAAAITVYIFMIVAVTSIISFRRTRRLEEVYA